MAWVELCIPKVAREQVARASERLFELGAAGVQEEDLNPPPFRQPWDTGPEPDPSPFLRLLAWFQDPDPPLIGRELAPIVTRRVLARITWEVVPETDWEEEWKQGFLRTEISARLAIAPPWLARPGDVVIEPGCAFGTGAHPSTLACLRQIDDLAATSRRLLDVGCGSGILSMAGARLGLAATGIDVDPAAVEEARRNAGENGLSIHFSNTPLRELEGTWDLVVCNLYAEAIVELAPELARRCSRWLVVAGLLCDRAHRVEAALPMVVEERASDGTWAWMRLRAP